MLKQRYLSFNDDKYRYQLRIVPVNVQNADSSEFIRPNETKMFQRIQVFRNFSSKRQVSSKIASYRDNYLCSDSMDSRAVVISGEASESDDESVNVTTGMGFPLKLHRNPCGTIISGEAPESDDDGTSLSSISGAIEATVCPPYSEAKFTKSKRDCVKYNSLLHKKLRECNEALDKDVLEASEGATAAAVQELTAINRQLLRSELILQEAACQVRNASNRSRVASNALLQQIDANFLYSIKI